MEEQNVPEKIEYDGLDHDSIHYAIKAEDGEIIATCRVREVKKSELFLIERAAVSSDYRGQECGKKLMLFVTQDITSDFPKAVIQLAAQSYVEGFYSKLGFVAIGKKYFKAGIEHIDMVIRPSSNK